MLKPKPFRFAFQFISASHTIARPFVALVMIGLFVVGLGATSSVFAASITTDSLSYDLGSEVSIQGASFQANETVRLTVTYYDGTPLPDGYQDTWYVVASGTGTISEGGLSGVRPGEDESLGFMTSWTMFTAAMPGDTLLLTAVGEISGLEATTSFACPVVSIDQLQNGIPANPAWSNGNINKNNSCYAEGSTVPFRYFIKSLNANTTHTFQISFAATNGGKHAYDYLSQYNLSESGPIITVGGECSSVSQPPPSDCDTPIPVIAFRDPRLASSYTSTPGAELSGIINPSFPLDGPGSLYAYNATNLSISRYTIGGTSTNRTLTVTITFKTQHSGSAGFFWGGHMAEGVTPGWGVGMGAGSVTGASWHMAAGQFDGSGGLVNRSIQKGTICMPPALALICAAGPYCTDATKTCSATAGASSYVWTVTGGTILSGQGTNTITYKITASPGNQVLVEVHACNGTSGCGGSSCCADASTQFAAEDCCQVTITCPPTATVACGQSTNPSATGTATFTTSGGCPLPITISYTDTETAGPCPQTKTISRLWKATDNNGLLRAQCIQTINVVDNVAPVLSNCPGPITVQCSSIPTPATPSATDNCDATPTITLAETTTPGACAQSYTLTRTWTAADDCGNLSTCSQVITVQDTQAPSLTCPPTVNVQCVAEIPAPNTSLVTAVDNCDPAPVKAFVSDVSNGLSCPETITRTYSATDACGNTATCTQLIVIDDTTLPVVTCPAPISVQCLADVPAPNPSLVSSTDNCDPNPVEAWVSDDIGTTTCPKIIIRTYKATDACGNIGTCTQTITVDDTTPPVITCPANTSILCGASSDPTQTGYATAVDNCTASGSIVIAYSDVTGASVITRTWTATDECGNQSSCVQTITTPPDTTPPVIVNCPGDMTVDCFANVPSPAPLLIVANDNCDPNPVASYVSDVQSGTSCPYTITRTFVVTDASGNSTTCTQIITVDDNTPPVLAGCPSNVTVDCNAVPAAATVTATDNCAGVTVGMTETETPGACAQEKTITRTWTATDFCGNTAICTQIITVVDNTAPVIVTSPGPVSVQCVANVPAPNTSLVTATDNCDPAPVISFVSDVSNGLSCPETITRTYRAQDACGNATLVTQIITVDDTTPPTISCPAPVSVQCVSNVPAANPALCTSSDNCDPTPTLTFVGDTQSGSGCPLIITRTYKAVDDCGNEATCTQTITVDDTTPPVITCPANTSVLCGGSADPSQTGYATATDNCSLPGNVAITYTDAFGTAITRTWTATDECGNQSSCVQTISTPPDTTPPSITSCPGDIVVDCFSNVPSPAPALVVATDNCDATPVSAHVSDVQSGTSCPYTITRTYRVTDASGNSTDCVQIITIDDNTPPVLAGCPSNVTVDCNAVPTPANVTATDNCAGVTVGMVQTETPGACAQEKTITRTWTATDFCGNTAVCSQVITVIDNTAPAVVTSPGAISVQCAADVPAPNTSLVTVTDNCDPAPVIAYVGDVSNGLSCPETITRTYSATDACGNVSLITQIITVDDTTPPTITCPAPVAVECMSDVPSPNAALCTATDNCDATPTVTFVSDTQSGSGCPLTITRTYKAVDDCGNEATCTQTITVNDQTPPTITCPAPVAVQCAGDVPVPSPALCTASDNCDPTPTVTFVSDSQSGSGCSFVITRTYKAVDDCGNEAFCTQTITVEDTTSPTISCPAPIAVNCITDVPAANPTLCTASDNCDPTPTVTFVSDTQSGTGCPLTITRTYKAVDDCGNDAYCTQTITVDDEIAPTITCPAPISVQCASLVPTPDPLLCTASDNCDPTPTVAFVSDVSNGQSCPEVITRTYKATDDCGNVAFCTQTITVDDTVAPALTCPAATSVQCMADVPTPNPALCTVTDNCDPTPTVTFVNDVQNGAGCPLTITRTYQAVDDCGNESFCTQTITVNDQTAPVITCPAPVAVQCVGDVPAPNTALVTATDNCDPNPVIVWVGDNSSGSCPITITRTYRATDDCGNVANCTQIITVDDTTPPVLAGCPSNVSVECGNIPAPAVLTATDNCSSVTAVMTETITPGSCAQSYTITRTWTATDACDNQAQCQQVITVRDTTPPQITCPDAITVNCLSDAPAPNPAAIVVTDNCDPAPVVTFVSDAQEGTGCPMYVVRTYRAVDACGNAATCTQIITVDDQELPQLVGCPGDRTIQCDEVLPPVATVTATDNCGPATVAFAQTTTPGNCPSNYTITRTWTATDVCGNQNSCQQVIAVVDVIAPQITCPVTVTVECIEDVPQPTPALVVATDNCDPAPVVTFVSDVHNTVSECPREITRTYRATDACGNSAICTQMINVYDTTRPVFTVFPTDQTIIQCQPTQIALPFAAVDNCAAAPEHYFDGPGDSLVNGVWYYTPSHSVSFDVRIYARDLCGAVSRSFHVDITINSAPVLTNCPSSAQVHWGQTYTYDLNAADVDAGDDLTFGLCPGAPASASINPTTGVLTFTATAQDICDPSLCVIVTDECNKADTCTFNICVDNFPPVLSCPEDQTLCYGYPLETQVTATDPDGGPYRFFYLVSGPSGVQVDVASGLVTWPNPTPGTHDVCVMVTDSAAVCSPCSPANADTCCFAVKVVSLDLVIEKVHDQIQGQYTDVSIDFKNQGTNWPIAGYDLLIQYDASALSFQMATEGDFFTDCEWEYFTYRFGSTGNCGAGACPTGVLRIVALAETSGGNLATHPDCFANDDIANPGPNSTMSTQLAVMRFLVSNDRTLECQYVPIRFIWYDCGDNGLSNVKGDTLFMSHMVFDYAGETGLPPVVQWNEITGLDNTMPTVTGAPSPECDLSFKYEVIRCANFYNGGVDIICADSIDAPGDINLNDIPYEIADAVMLTNYFVTGLAAFGGHIDGSIAASDANRDGVTLSVSDLVLLIRVVVGDCLPYAKEQPMAAVSAGYFVEDGVVSVTGDYDISGVALVVRGDASPQLLATDMDMAYYFDGSVTRIVVTSPLDATSMHSFRGAFIKGIHGGIVSLELATSDGAPVNARNIPAHFSLSQNYPNPFNPVTTVEFALPDASDYRLTIYNIEGRLVDEFQGRADAPGVFHVDWNAGDRASGVYLYRLDAGQFSQTRKMLLLK